MGYNYLDFEEMDSRAFYQQTSLTVSGLRRHDVENQTLDRPQQYQPQMFLYRSFPRGWAKEVLAGITSWSRTCKELTLMASTSGNVVDLAMLSKSLTSSLSFVMLLETTRL